MVAIRNIDLFQSLPQIDQSQREPYNFDAALRSRLQPINDIGNQQNVYSAQKRDERAQAAYMARLQQLQQYNNPGNWPSAGGMPVAGKGWFNPIGNGKYGISFDYGATYKNGKRHTGYDIATPVGTPLYAPSGGKVVMAGWDPYGGKSGGFGTSLRIQNPDNTYTILGHLSSLLNSIKVGQILKAGQLIGYSGSSGNSTGPHTHVEFRNSLLDPGSSIDFGYLFGW